MTNEEFLRKAKIKSPTLLPLEDYVKSALSILVKCTICNYTWKVRASHILFGDANCPECSRKSRTKTFEDFKNQVAIKNPNLEILSEYKNSMTKVRIKCKVCGTENEVLAKNLLRQGGCLKCGGRIKRTNEEIISDFKKVHGEKYNYSKVNFIDYKIPVEIICKIHGPFMQRPDTHLLGCGCKKCFYDQERDDTQSFIQKAKIVHGDLFDYSKVHYKDSVTPIKIICSLHGEFLQKPNNHLNSKCGCPKCKESLGERTIRKYFLDRNISVISQKSFKDLYNKSIKNKLKYDFFVEKYNLLIEFNGVQHYRFCSLWHKDLHSFHEAIHRDWLKRKYAKDNNFNYLVISYKDFNKITDILDFKVKELSC